MLRKDPTLWMVAPVSAAKQIAESSNAQLISLASHPERRIFYIAKSGYSSEIMDQFLRHLMGIISKIDEISIIAEGLMK